MSTVGPEHPESTSDLPFLRIRQVVHVAGVHVHHVRQACLMRRLKVMLVLQRDSPVRPEGQQRRRYTVMIRPIEHDE
jgi:hypothetical protein